MRIRIVGWQGGSPLPLEGAQVPLAFSPIGCVGADAELRKLDSREFPTKPSCAPDSVPLVKIPPGEVAFIRVLINPLLRQLEDMYQVAGRQIGRPQVRGLTTSGSPNCGSPYVRFSSSLEQRKRGFQNE